MLLAPMAVDGREPTGSMGNDAALAVLSDRQPPLFSYFKQLFAQVTNPPIDSVREQVVMSLSTRLGPEGDLLEETPAQARRLVLDQPVLRDHEPQLVLRAVGPVRWPHTPLDATWPVVEGPDGLAGRSSALPRGRPGSGRRRQVLILSDRGVGGPTVCPCPPCWPCPACITTPRAHGHARARASWWSPANRARCITWRC